MNLVAGSSPMGKGKKNACSHGVQTENVTKASVFCIMSFATWETFRKEA